MIRRRLPLVSLPKLTVPLRSASIAESFGFARLEQIGYPRQTAGDVARLRGFLRNTRDHVADRNLYAVLEADNGAGRQRINSRNIRIRESHFLAFCVRQPHDRSQILAARAPLLRIEHDRAGQTGNIVHLRRHRDAVDEVLELDHAGHFGDDRVRMRIPVRDRLPGGHDIAVVDRDRRAVGDLVAFTLAAEFVDDAQLAGPRHRDQVASSRGARS